MESHGNGRLNEKGYYNTVFLKKLGKKTVLEEGVLLFHPENISIHDNVYIGHNTILKGYYKNEMIIEEGTWIGQQCFFHSAGFYQFDFLHKMPCSKTQTLYRHPW